MLPRPVVALAALVLVIPGCSFDTGGLQTGSNSAGTLESSGSGGSEDPSTTASTDPTASTSASTTGPQTTSATADTTVSTTDDPTTTMPSSETAMDESTTGDPGTTSTDAMTESQGTTTEVATTTGDTSSDPDPYGMCGGDGDCGGGMCVDLYLDFTLNHHVCYPPCMADEDCPAIATGNAIPFCTDSGCALYCDGYTCPDGMECVYNSSGGRRCGWAD